jgi:hypothetical protein
MKYWFKGIVVALKQAQRMENKKEKIEGSFKPLI